MKISVKAHPKSKVEKFVQIDAAHCEVWVSAAPDKGRANQAIIEKLSAHFNLAKSRIKIVSGQTSKNKIFEIT